MSFLQNLLHPIQTVRNEAEFRSFVPKKDRRGVRQVARLIDAGKPWLVLGLSVDRDAPQHTGLYYFTPNGREVDSAYVHVARQSWGDNEFAWRLASNYERSDVIVGVRWDYTRTLVGGRRPLDQPRAFVGSRQ